MRQSRNEAMSPCMFFNAAGIAARVEKRRKILGLATPCFFEPCTIWIRRHTVYVSVAVESKTAVKLYG